MKGSGFLVLIPYLAGNHPDPITFEKPYNIKDLQRSCLYIKRDIEHLTLKPIISITYNLSSSKNG